MKRQRSKQKLQKPKISYYKKPDHLTIDEWQRELRKAFVREEKQLFGINYIEGEHPVFADYAVKNLSGGGSYKVALRSSTTGPNFCTCLDFKTNMLGTCKHIEAVLYHLSKDKKLAPLLADDYRPSYSSLFLKYGAVRQVMLRIGTKSTAKYETLALAYCDDQYHLLPDSFGRIDRFLEEARRVSSDFRCYQDAIDFIIAARDNHTRRATISRKITRRHRYFDRLLKVPLYPFQKEGILFAARAGRSLIADDMGLGKTIQAIGAAELLQKEFGINRALIVCPTSLKYQWQTEIRRFTGRDALVIEGNARQRQPAYDADNFYAITNYNVVGADLAAINQAEFDLVILDEAQRIKNWQTKTAQAVKQIASKYAVVLTGTPIENKLEELYSIIQFIDPFKLGPLYKFLAEHQILDGAGKVVGYRELNKIQTLLSDIVIRRTRKNVLKQLPGRTDKNLFVPLTHEQADIHQEYAEVVSRLVSKWRRFWFLDEKDRQRLLISLNCMRMVSDSTYILDQETRYDTKIGELMSILEDILVAEDIKVVVFSQWERMTRLVGIELKGRQVGFAHLHGSVPSYKRKALLADFHNNPTCRVFLSTDAGGVGLNLQCASSVINLDLPWNPAVLEQRIGRIYRHGQKRPVNVINLVSQDSIEQRMLDVLKFKSSLFAGVLDGGEDRIFMGEDKFKRFMGHVEQVASAPTPPPTPTPQKTGSVSLSQPSTSPTELFAAATNFLGNLAALFSDRQKSRKLISTFVEKDIQSGKQYLKIALENEQVVTNALNSLSTLLSGFK